MHDSLTRNVTESGGSTPSRLRGVLPPQKREPGWYALRVASNREFRVWDWLGERGFEGFVPTVAEETRWSDRRKVIDRPLFPGYIFVRRAEGARLDELLRIPGIVQALPTNLAPELVDEYEIANLRMALAVARATGRPAAECPYVACELVTIERGPLAGIQGVVTRTRGAARVAVRIEILRRSVSVEVDVADLEKG
jgi:transcription antitermination factor NusG